jgi:alkanesulfonate monooxygenase SsuD/methylene tetrahydromethanopterin reductase-like flavin-dependent oxidoreductase (luciferase family)
MTQLHPLTYGAWIPQGFVRELRGIPRDSHVDAMIRVSRCAEALGYDSLWVGDHLHSGVTGENDPIYESWLLLAAMSQHTSRVRLGHLVVANTFRAPSLVAKMAATLDGLSNGRFDLGIGAAWHEEEHRGYGLPFPPAGERVDMLGEAVDVIRLMWTKERTDFAGRFYHLEGGQCDPKPVQSQPRILIGGVGRKTLGVVAQKADRWNFYGTHELFESCTDELDAACRAIGRDPLSVERSWFPTGVVLRETKAEATRVIEELQRQRNLPKVFHALHGTPEWFMTKMAMYARRGVTGFMPGFGDYPDTTSLELFASQVIPSFEVSA